MDKLSLLEKAKTLLAMHKQATALQDEYSAEIYDFLEREGRISLSKQEKIQIFEDAKKQYVTELQSVIRSGDYSKALDALNLINSMKADNGYSEEQKQYLALMCKRIVLKQYLDKVDKIDINYN